MIKKVWLKKSWKSGQKDAKKVDICNGKNNNYI